MQGLCPVQHFAFEASELRIEQAATEPNSALDAANLV